MLSRIKREKLTIQAMIKIYCNYQHSEDICDSCNNLLNYALSRLDNCPFQEDKPVCNHCEVHCYSKKKQAEIKKVMSFSGA